MKQSNEGDIEPLPSLHQFDRVPWSLQAPLVHGSLASPIPVFRALVKPPIFHRFLPTTYHKFRGVTPNMHR
jgi:hypothetical protein